MNTSLSLNAIKRMNTMEKKELKRVVSLGAIEKPCQSIAAL